MFNNSPSMKRTRTTGAPLDAPRTNPQHRPCITLGWSRDPPTPPHSSKHGMFNNKDDAEAEAEDHYNAESSVFSPQSPAVILARSRVVFLYNYNTS